MLCLTSVEADALAKYYIGVDFDASNGLCKSTECMMMMNALLMRLGMMRDDRQYPCTISHQS